MILPFAPPTPFSTLQEPYRPAFQVTDRSLLPPHVIVHSAIVRSLRSRKLHSYFLKGSPQHKYVAMVVALAKSAESREVISLRHAHNV